MPNCKNCGSRISKFDKDRCPVCGTVAPLKGVSSDTVEITSEIDLKSGEFKFKPKERNVAVLFFFLLGFTGAGFFYLVKKKTGLIWLIGNLLVIGLLFLLFYLPVNAGLLWAIVIPMIISYIVNIVVGFFYLMKSDIKDGRGEFIR